MNQREVNLTPSAERHPLTPDDLTVAWLQHVLVDHLDGAEIKGFERTFIGVGEGFNGQLFRLHLTYAGHAANAPRSLIAKFAPADPESRAHAKEQNLYQREIGFYRDIGQKAGISIPLCYYCREVEEGNHFLLLLEDLAPGQASDQVEGTDKATSRLVVEQMARLHARWWNDGRLEDYSWARWIINEHSIGEGLAMLQGSIAQAEITGRFDAYPEMKRLIYLLPPLFRVEPAPPYPFSLTHGDLRSDNVIRPTEAGGRFALIDWQLAGKGDPINDLVRWMVQSITIEDRRETEQELLKLYYDRLLENGVKGYSYKAFMNGYKRNIVVVLVMFSMSMDAVDTSSERAQALFHAFYSRLDAALVDWEIEKLLKVLPYLVPLIKFSSWLKAKLAR